MRLKKITTATALALMWPTLSAQAEQPDWICFPSAGGGWDCRDGATATVLPPRPPTPTGDSEIIDAVVNTPSGSPLELYMAHDRVAADGSIVDEETAIVDDTGASVAGPALNHAPQTPPPPGSGQTMAAAPTARRGPVIPGQQTNQLAVAPTRRSPVTANMNDGGYLGGLFATRPDRDTINAFNVWGQCGNFDTNAELRPKGGAGNGDQPIDITADFNEIYGEELAEFKGNVEFVQGNRVIHADFLRFNIPENELELIGQTYMKDYDIEVWGNYAKFDMGQDEGVIEKAGYRLNSRHAQGRANKIYFEEHGDIVRLAETSYSTCPAVKEDWAIESNEITLDNVEQKGVARNATLRFKGVPVAWTPYMSFPLTPERQSGLLRPKVGVGDKTGVDVTVPYYWNIAPNQDATIGVRGMSKRGVQLQGQYRYLTEKNSGEISAEYMPNDKEFGDYRAVASYQQRGYLLPKLRSDVNINWASDDDYFRDLGSNLTTTSIQFLERRGDLVYEGENWDLLARAQEFQTLDPDLSKSLRPYKRLPQFLFDTKYPWRWHRAELDLRAEAVNWGHEVNVEGQRYDIKPTLSMPFVSLWGYVTPKVSAQYTSYKLDQRTDGGPDSINRFIPSASVDAGLFFERDTSWGGKGVTQTIEPRMYYLFVKDKEQSDIPLFDTSQTDFSFAQLFQDNRFSGTDRIGDANQLSLALTSRLLESDSGQERFSASLGSIFYFKDREVTLLGGPAQTDSTSEIAFGLSATPGSYWNVDMDVQYDPHQSLWTKRALRVNYKRDFDHIANAYYRRREINDQLVDVDQVGFSAYWALTKNWKAITNVAWSLQDSTLVEFLGGVHYDTCCWSVMLAYRQFVQDNTGTLADNGDDKNANILLMFELKGLGRYGQELYDLMERGILGYNAPPETTL